LPLSIEAVELGGPLPADGWAYLQRIEAEGAAGVCRFHGAIMDVTGRVYLKVRDLCLKGTSEAQGRLRSGSANIENGAREHGLSGFSNERGGLRDITSVLADLASGNITVEVADERLADLSPDGATRAASEPPQAVECLASDLCRRMPAAELRFCLRLGAEALATQWTVSLHAGSFLVKAGASDAEGPVIIVTPENLQRLMDGEVDPTALFLRGELSFLPDSARAFRQKIGALWFERFNSRHLPDRFREHPIGRIYSSGEVTAGPEVRREIFPWALSADAGAALYRLVRDKKLNRTLEIGMAYGLSSLFICQGHQDKGNGEHVAIDPCQRGEFLSIGLANVRAAGLESRLRFIEEPDYLALPALVREGNGFSLVFIDGLHMFDYTLLDFFYADRLLAEQGYLVFDDCLVPGVAKAIDYVRSNRAYEVLDVDCERLVVFQKKGPDARSLEDPNFHREF
jgi:predicted O-methyltransferase YrrM